MFNMGDLMGQMKDMQEKMQAQQEELMRLEVLGEAGAGLVSVRMNGRRDVIAVNIDDTLFSEDKTVLQDLLASAITDANQKAEKLLQTKMGDMLGGMGMPRT